MAAVLQKAQAALGLGVVAPTVGTKLQTGIKLKEHSVATANVDLDNVPGKIIVVGVPGAFTPTCSTQVPGYIENFKSFTSKGVQGIYVVSVNDAFVAKAWGEKLGASSNPDIHFLADDTGAWTSAIGMGFDGTSFFGNFRSHRYAMLVEDGVVKAIEQETDDGTTTVSKAENFLAKL